MGSTPSNLKSSSIPKALDQRSTLKVYDFSLLDNEEPYDDLDMNLKKLENLLAYLIELKSASNIIKDKRAFKSFVFMSKLSKLDNFRDSRVQYDMIMNYESVIPIFVDMYSTCFEYFKQFVSTNEYVNDESKNGDKELKKLKKTSMFIAYLNSTVWLFTECSNAFRIKFHQSGGTKTIFELYISDEAFIQNCLKLKLSKDNPNDDSYSGVMFLRSIMAVCHNLSKLVDNTKTDWINMNATMKLMRFSELIKEYPSIHLSAYMTVANVVNEKEIETLSDTKCVIKDIIEIINIGAHAIVTRENLKRIKIEIHLNDDSHNTEAVLVSYKDAQYNIIELLDTLNRIAVNDNIKYEIYETYDMKKTLKMIIMEGNFIEKEYSTRLLWQLCFDKRVCKAVLEDSELIDYLIDFNQNNINSRNSRVKKNIFGILWLNSQPKNNPISRQEMRLYSRQKKIRDMSTKKLDQNVSVNNENYDLKLSIEENQSKKETIRKMESKSADDFDGKTKNEHIMISYNNESRELCLKIKSELEKENCKVWIDVEDIHGSSLESMAKAVEQSFCVLMCVTEKYKLSPNCRAEAEYAFNLHKPIIPLIMQADFIPDGWLGIILGTKIYVNFTKFPFDECVRKTKKEIENYYTTVIKNDSPLLSSSESKKPLSDSNASIKNKGVKSWTAKDVENWLKDKQIDFSIQTNLSNFDGELLHQLYSMSKDAPEFYFQTISNNNKLELFSIIKFSNELSKLFQ